MSQTVHMKCACCNQGRAFRVLAVRSLHFGYAVDAECPKGHWVHVYMRRAP